MLNVSNMSEIPVVQVKALRIRSVAHPGLLAFSQIFGAFHLWIMHLPHLIRRRLQDRSHNDLQTTLILYPYSHNLSTLDIRLPFRHRPWLLAPLLAHPRQATVINVCQYRSNASWEDEYAHQKARRRV